MEDNAMQSGYVTANGLNIYYEIHGTGEPLVLLHGGVVGIPMFGANLAVLAQSRKVIAVELQGHGRTSDSDRSMSFEAMADDVIAVMAQLEIEQADVMGYSLGGGVALQFVIRHPESVRKLILVSQPFAHDGWYPEVLSGFEQMGPATGEPMKNSPLSQMFPNVDWSRLFTKAGELLRQDFDWSGAVASITAPTLLVFADADAILPAHIVDFFGLLGGGQRDAGWDGSGRPTNQLAVLPGLTHYNIIESPLIPNVVNPFLDAS